MATYAIGDIQGCLEPLQQLLKKIAFNSDRDQLWLTGDLVNRGPQSLATLEYLYAMQDNVVTVLGNHDLHLLATAYDHEKPGKKDTLDDVLLSPRRDELMHWLRQRPLIHHDNELNITMVHAGLHPDWSIDKAIQLANEVETTLRGDNHIDFYRHMYGDKPTHWSDDLNGWQRLRYITNILTRLRYIDHTGKAALQAKGAPGNGNKKLTPWFDIPGRAHENDRIVFGHWSTLALIERDYDNVYPVDSGCLWGGKLTALRIDTEPYEASAIHCAAKQTPDKD